MSKQLPDPLVWVARALLEAETPIHVGAGRGDTVSDADVVRDLNGLPTIPGTSLAGVLRSAYEARRDMSHGSRVFGYQAGAEGAGSRLWVSFGRLLDASGRVVEGLREEEDDDVLRLARTGFVRDHVRLDDRGVADDRGKFDERLVPAGVRFLCEISLAGDEAFEEDFELLVSLLGDDLRVGGGTRNGLGRLRLVRLQRRRFDLRREADVLAYESLSANLRADEEALGSWMASRVEPVDRAREVRATLQLEADSPWGIGGDGPESRANIGLYTEPRVVWGPSDRAWVERDYVVPATSLKGVLAHRVAFHDNVVRGRFADGNEAPLVGEENPSVRELFGFVKDSAEGAERGAAGKLFLGEARLPVEGTRTHVITHNGIDRYTGGTRGGILFTEEVLARGSRFEIDLAVAEHDSLSQEARQALKRTLDDLERGWLQVGHGSGRGNGRLRGRVDWEEGAGEWLQAKEEA